MANNAPAASAAAGGVQYKGNLASIMEAEEGEVGPAIHELVASITKRDDQGALRWMTAAGQKVARKVLENKAFLPKIVHATATLTGGELADALMVLTWLGKSSKEAIIEIVKPEASDSTPIFSFPLSIFPTNSEFPARPPTTTSITD
jgi:hypothetical protein